MAMKRKQLTENHNVSKQFNYSKGDVSLGFSLRVDTKSQLKDFKDLLIKAIEDLEEEIAK